MTDHEDRLGGAINHILMNDETVKLFIRDYESGLVNSLECYDQIYYRVEYVYSFKARENSSIYRQRIAELTHFFIMGAQEEIIKKMDKQIKRYQVWCQFCMLPLMFLILWMLYEKI